MSQILSFRFPTEKKDAFYDEIRCKAFEYAKSCGKARVCLLLVSFPDQMDAIQVVANLNSEEASIVLPLPDWEKNLSFGTAFSFSDRVFIISESDSLEVMQGAIEAFQDQKNLFWFTLNRSAAEISGVYYEQSEAQWTPAARSAEAAAAAAMVLHRNLQNGTMESTIDQPGGLLEIGLRKENGKVLGLSAGGPVEVRK